MKAPSDRAWNVYLGRELADRIDRLIDRMSRGLPRGALSRSAFVRKLCQLGLAAMEGRGKAVKEE